MVNYPRHMGMDMGGSATMTMNMASATNTMAMASSTMSLMMDMSDGMSMNMFFTTLYKDYPVVFQNLSASTKAQAFGIFLLFFFIAFVARGIEFVRMYLEQFVWKTPAYVECHPDQKDHGHLAFKEGSVADCCNDDDSDDSISKPNSAVFRTNSFESDKKDDHVSSGLPMASRVFRDVIRLGLCILPDLFGYTLMLVAMTYSLPYFFSVVLGSGIGRFFFERLSDKLNLKSTSGFARHC